MEIVRLKKRRFRLLRLPDMKPGSALRRILIGVGILLLVLIAWLGCTLWSLGRPFGDRDVATVMVIGADEPEAGRSRADTMLLVRIQLRPERRITILSLPRDSRVKIPGRKRFYKLNAAFAMGGSSLARQTVAANFGIKVDYFIVLRSAGLAKVVDAIGGVEMDVPRAMDYDDRSQNLHIHLKPGLQHLNGDQAVGFVRFRHDGRGDIGRVQRQQMFLKAVAKQAMNLGLLRRWGRVEPALRAALQTDLASSQLLALAYCLRGLTTAELRTATLPGRAAYIHGVSYYLPESRRAVDLLEGRSTVALHLADASPDVGDRWAVLNGCRRNGYARRAARQLRAAGIDVIEIANAPPGAYPQTEALVAAGDDKSALQKGPLRILGCGRCVETDSPRPDGAYEMIVGDDFRPADGF